MPAHLPRDRPLRVLFAACSTGEEVWSFLSRFARRLTDRGLEVVAVDVCRDALAVAALGQYSSWSLRGTAPQELEGWVRREGRVVQVDPWLLELPRFQQHNLLRPLDPIVAPGRADVVLCRNMLMYLHGDALKTVWGHLERALAPDGVILTAATDPGPPADGPLVRRWEAGFPLHLRRPASRQPEPAPPPATPRPPPPPSASPAVRRSTPAAPSPGPSAALEGWMDQARIYAHAGRHGLAAYLIDQVLEESPFEVEALLLSALLRLEGGEGEEALAAARKAVYVAPASPYAHYVMASTLRGTARRGAAARAIRSAEEALAGLNASTQLEFSDGLTAGQLREILRAL